MLRLNVVITVAFVLVLTYLKLVASQYEDPDYPNLLKMSFNTLNGDNRMKFAMFTDDKGDPAKTKEFLSLANDLATLDGLNEYVWIHCDCSNNGCKEAFTEGFPRVFTQTPEEGISQFPAYFSRQNCIDFYNFRAKNVTEHNVIRYENNAQVKKLLESKPIFMKMYEVKDF